MDTSSNPFLRGFAQFTITRTLLIDSSDGGGMCYRAPHFLHAELPDSQLEGTFCQFNSDFALVPERQHLPENLLRQCPKAGFVSAVVHSITAQNGTSTVHVGDARSAQSAQEILRQMSFNTGHYSRCWEISSKHLPPLSMRWLERCASGAALSADVLFYAFELPGTRHAIGCLLNSTPWTDGHLRNVAGFDSHILREAQEGAQIPMSLLNLLHQAAVADTRILIFDPDAPVLEGLLLHE
jgi:hypothetical protein